jgi:hypothetical protein
MEVPGLNLGPETSHLDRVFSWFSSVPPGKYRDSFLKLGHDSFLPNPFQLSFTFITVVFDASVVK